MLAYHIKAFIKLGSNKLQAAAIIVKRVAITRATMRGLSSQPATLVGAQLQSPLAWRKTIYQLAATARIENTVMGQRIDANGASAELSPVLSPAPASAIGRIQQEHAASTAPTLLTMLTNVVLASPIRAEMVGRS